MAKDLNKTIKSIGERLVGEFKKRTPKASGRTADSIEYEIKGSKLLIKGDSHIQALIDGRSPTGSSAKKGNPTLQQSILEWLSVKGIRPRESSITQEALSWAISKSIHKKGFKGKGDFYKPIKDNTIEIQEEIRKAAFEQFLSELDFR